jgi:hypothetical protein
VEGWSQLIDAGCLWKGKPGKPSGERCVKVVSCFNNGWLEEKCIILMHLTFIYLIIHDRGVSLFLNMYMFVILVWRAPSVALR